MGLLCEYADLYDSELYETAVRYERLTRQQKGSRQGDLGSWGIEVLGVLLLAADDTGVACLPQTRIADSAGMSPAAVSYALQRLIGLGVIARNGRSAWRANLAWEPLGD